MKANWLLPSVVLFVASCEKPAPIIAAPEPERKLPMPPKIGDTSDSSISAPAEKREKDAPASEQKPAEARNTVQAPPPPPEPAGMQEATPVQGQPGMVYSPFSGKVVDVRDIPPGTLVADPTFPASEKKHFRVPR